MNLAFLAPLMLAGAALLGAPYFIHRIRRPDREPLRFSSLMFIPDVKQEVIERRRLQHLLLMLTRMAILAALVMAFARPFAKAAVLPSPNAESARHVILLDQSYSMAAGDRFDDAKRAAESVLAVLGPEEEVAVVGFGVTPRILAPFANEAERDAGTVSRAREALRQAELTQEATNYAGALRMAEGMLLSDGASDVEHRFVHLISDLQRTGMPLPGETWKLAPNVQLAPISVSDAPSENFAVSDVIARRAASGDLRVVGKVKNWTDSDATAVELSLVVDGRRAESMEKPIKAGNATQFSFVVRNPGDDAVSGYLELPGDSLTIDNRRYFVWSPPAKHEVLIVSGAAEEARDGDWPEAWFFEKALPTGGAWPFVTRRVDGAEMVEAFARPGVRPSAVIVCDADALAPAVFEALRGYAESGGAVLMTLGPGTETFAASLGYGVEGPRYAAPRAGQFELLSWVDLQHPVFEAFQGHVYNDFSALRFQNFVVTTPPDSATIVASFESGAPAIVDDRIGEGSVTLWTFPVRLSASNLPKSPRFVPVLYETMRRLCRVEESVSSWEIGDMLRARNFVFDADGTARVQVGDADTRTLDAEDSLALGEAGVITLGAGTPGERLETVNVHAAESDPSAVEPGEFELRMASTSRSTANDRDGGGGDRDEPQVALEYGAWLLLLALAGIAFESAYMAYLTRQKQQNRSTG